MRGVVVLGSNTIYELFSEKKCSTGASHFYRNFHRYMKSTDIYNDSRLVEIKTKTSIEKLAVLLLFKIYSLKNYYQC